MKKKKIIDYPHTNMMTLEEWKQFVKNYDSEFSSGNVSLKKYLKRSKNISFARFIAESFNWSSTEQGWVYWNGIARRIKPVS